ncbi:NADAR family protein [Chryseobacterium sp. JJR-5R]|uniref:NADAR family protein n=1 Tax=Chryseobacterium sp. JJR-5R TaxID=3093923 RepID=UPI002A757BAC|nr:NADAR family protein [Chryseobacterium sp. JJR-5R]WPO82787.1 NADAR family protein [Chryseobacterium sp. JJR-5R]
MKYTQQDIINCFRNDEKFPFLFFWGHTVKDEVTKACFSQWFPAAFEEKGVIYRTAEHYMMAGKAELFDDHETLREIIHAETPGQAESLGRKVRNFDPQVWDRHKYEIVKQGNLLKFSQHQPLKTFLLSTENKILVEASPYDTVWGIGMPETDPKAENPLHWQGENLLGFVLMEVRDELKLKYNT